MRMRGLALFGVLITSSIAAWAVTTQFWENFSQEELLKGSLKDVSLTNEGKLLAAPVYDLFYDTGQPYIFSMVRDRAGNLYVGTGSEGKVFRIDPQGKGSLYFQSKELDVFAMALDSADTLYVGTSPDGKVYKVTGPTQFTEFCNPETKYIWAMVFDGSGNLYVGTGATGTIYKIDKTGKKTSFYTCPDNNVVTLTRSDNNLLAGTSPGGLVVEITPEGKGFTRIDIPLEEVHALAADRFGTVYAVASSSRGLNAAPSPKAAPAAIDSAGGATAVVTMESGVVGLADKPKEKPAAATEAGTKSAIYAISKDGGSEVLYSSPDLMVFDAILRPDGSLLAATGPKGRLLSISPAKQVTVVSDTPEEDATRLVAAGDVTYVGGSNQGKVYRLASQKAQTGVFESAALDAKTVASWGRISWHAAGPGIEIQTRTGNTEKADNSWSDWSSPYASPGQQITSPRARYLQWRATFKEGSDMLDRVQIAYLQQNLRPQVTSVEVLPSGIELQKQPSLLAGGLTLTTPATTPDGRSLNSPREHGRERQPQPPRQVLVPGAQSFTWKATDENGDALEYSLYFRGEGESDWKLLERKLTDTFYSLNTASLPDGTYRIKVVASDAPSNPYDKFLIGEMVSEPFLVANTSPQIEITGNRISGRKVELQFRARVPIGNIATAEFSVDGGDWLLVFPVDGIADSAVEEYSIVTSELSPGEHLIGIRSSDRNGTTGTSKLLVKIP